MPEELHAWAREDAALTNDEATALRDSLWKRLAPAVAAGAAASAGAALVASAATSATTGTAPSLVAKVARLTQLKLLGAGLAVGAVVGGGAVELSHSEQTPPPPIAQVAPMTEPAPTVASLPTPELLLQADPQPPAPSGKPPLTKAKAVAAAPASSPAAKIADETWDAERALVDAARTALLRNDLTSVRALTAEHSARFPDGALVEEREGMNVLARLRDPTDETAPEAARAFRARFPQSVLGRAITEAESARTSKKTTARRQGSATKAP